MQDGPVWLRAIPHQHALEVPYIPAPDLRLSSSFHSRLMIMLSVCTPMAFADVLRIPQNAVGEITVAAPARPGITMAFQRGPATEFARGITSELVVVAQRNISASSVRFDLGWGWREHFFRDAKPVYVIPAEAPARWRLNGESQCVYFAIDEASVRPLLEELGVSDVQDCLWTLAARGFNEALVHEMIERLWRELSAGAGCASLLVDSYRIAVLHTLARRASTLRAPQDGGRSQLGRSQLRQVLEYIEAHLGEQIAVADVAKVAGVSLFHFSRLFRNATGVAPYAFVTERRLQRAAERLQQSDDPVAQVAVDLGFTSASHFNRMFTKSTGYSPVKFRQIWRKPATHE